MLERKSVEEQGRQYFYSYYVPESAPIVVPTVYIFCPSEMKAEVFFEKYKWEERLEKYGVAGCFMESRDNHGWNWKEEKDWINKVYIQMKNGESYNAGEECLSVLGFGDGAYPATVFSLYNRDTIASFAVAGDRLPEAEILEQEDRKRFGVKAIKYGNKNQIPAWLISDNSDAEKLADFLKRLNNVQNEEWKRQEVSVYRQCENEDIFDLDAPADSEVWLCLKKEWKWNRESCMEQMLKFVMQFRRWKNRGNGNIRKAKNTNEMGLILQEMEIDGRKRQWYLYEPSYCKLHPGEKIPLVIALHGFSVYGQYFAENSGWSEVAEERRFFVVFPSAYPFKRKNISPSLMAHVLCPTWNSYPAEEEKESPDDIAFLCSMTDHLTDQYPIDPNRIYVTGHSNGSVMTQALMRYAPKRFAAFAPIGAMELQLKKETPFPEPEIKRPVWLIMGENDGKEGWSLKQGSVNDRNIRMLCKANRIDYNAAKSYICGSNHHLIVYDDEHVPLLRFTGIGGWPHTVTPSSSRMIYDEFFCHFKRNNKGTTEYSG